VFAVPAPSHELTVFVLRMVLKHSTWDAVLCRQGRLSRSERRELDWLLLRCDRTELRQTAQSLVPWVDTELWDRCVRAVDGTASLRERVLTAHTLTRVLSACARRRSWRDTTLRLGRRFTWGARRYVLRRRPAKRLANGGAVVAVLGGDGSGKSTTVAAATAWLGTAVATRAVHLGRPEPGLLTTVVKGGWRVAGAMVPAARRRHRSAASRHPASGGQGDGSMSVPALCWHVLTARDRYAGYVRARRFAAHGGVVVSDRFPLAELTLMDGPRAGAYCGAEGGGLRGRLARAEQRYYARITPPDVLVVLRCPPEVAVARRTDEEAEFVRRRNAEVHDIDWTPAGAHVIDAQQPLELVLADVRAAIWSSL
jgi:thymidylate kinase